MRVNSISINSQKSVNKPVLNRPNYGATTVGPCENLNFEGWSCLRMIGFQKPLEKLSELNLSEYKALSVLDKFFLRASTPKDIKIAAKNTLALGNDICKYFDKRYGKDNYTLISIGRSLAAPVEAAGLRGRHVVHLPLSSLSGGVTHEIKGVELYKEFLDSKGLTKEFIENNPERAFVLIDNSCSGESLKNAHALLGRDYLLGNPERLEIVTAEDVLGYKYRKYNMSMYFVNAPLKKYSPVGYLPVYDLRNVFRQSNYKTCTQYTDKIERDERKLFWFTVVDILNKYKPIK